MARTLKHTAAYRAAHGHLMEAVVTEHDRLDGLDPGESDDRQQSIDERTEALDNLLEALDGVDAALDEWELT